MHAFPRSSLLVLQNNAISSLIPSTLVDQVDALLDSHKIDDAAVLVDQRRRKLEGNLTVDPDEAEELEYVYQVIGFKCFSETLFDDAGKNLFNGALDPRVLVSYFPDLRGGLFAGTDRAHVYSGVADRMPGEKSVDDLIAINLVRNYSPHLSPEAEPIVELHRVLGEAARDMLLVFLEKSRRRARVEKRREDVRVDVTRVVDTVLAKLYASFGRQKDLRTLLSPPNDVVLPEIEPSLRVLGLLSPLADLYKQRGEEDKLLELYANCIDGTYTNTDIQDPLEDMLILLESKRDKDRKQLIKWGLWMLRKGDIDRGMKLLIPPELPKRRDRDRDKEEDRALLEQITEANADAGRRFLEYLVLMKRNTSPDLHTRLALACIDDLLQCLQDDSTSKLWRAKASSYASPRPTPSSHPTSSPTIPSPHQTRTRLPSPPPRTHHHQPQQPFLSYFASTTPDSTSKRTRLKALFMLSGSGVYDPRVVQERLFSGLNLSTNTTASGEKKTTAAGGGNVLALETAILYGKLEKHEAALEVLVRDLRDSTSAEAYCTLGGEVVPVKVALAVAESSGVSATSTPNSTAEIGLREWYHGLFEPPPHPHRQGRKATAGVGVGVGVGMGAGGEAPAIVRQRSVREDVKRELLRDLVGVYMGDATYGMEWTTRLLEAQGMNLDVVDVVKHVPEQWPLSSLDTFITRYFRRTLHTSYENVILKNLAAGQNLAVRERTWEILREQGCVFEEPDSDYDGGEEEGVVDEKAAYVQAEEFAEKVIVGGDEKTPSPPLPEENMHVQEVIATGEEPKGALGLVLGEPEHEVGVGAEESAESRPEGPREGSGEGSENQGSSEGSEGQSGNEESERQERNEEDGRQNENESQGSGGVESEGGGEES